MIKLPYYPAGTPLPVSLTNPANSESLRPPRTTGSDGGGGGDEGAGGGGGGGGDDGDRGSDDGDSEGEAKPSLRLLESAEERSALLNDWLSQTKIFEMSGSFGNPELAQVHTTTRQTLEALLEFSPSGDIVEGKQLVVALCYPKNSIMALVGMDISPQKILVTRLAVRPVQVHNTDESWAQYMINAVTLIGMIVGKPLDTTPLEENCYLTFDLDD